ncbi:uncharacterized protein LOC134839901 isoform X2 [Symsagittifera roscoffensis]|uniref:uncharacterized protein LOC134839901 isoform X2 n=1 Tax=Symsagittifera roscoffensis TaxID=84072 RepID=UPI00307C6047
MESRNQSIDNSGKPDESLTPPPNEGSKPQSTLAPATPNSAAALASGKKKWNKVKLGIKFTAKLKPKIENEAKIVPDIEYLLVSFLPHSLCFKEIFQTLSRFVEIDKNTTSSDDNNPYSMVEIVRRLPNLKNDKTAEGTKLERGSVIVDLNRPLIGGKKPDVNPETGEKGEEDKTVLVSLAFSTDPMYSPLCESKKEPTNFSEAELNHFGTFDRIFSLNPKVLVMRQRCLSDQPFEAKAWVKNFKWAFPQRPEDTFVKVDKEDMSYLNNFVAQCLHQDIKRRVAGRSPVAAKVIQIQPKGDWRLAHFDTM